MVDRLESLVYNLNQDIQMSGRRARTMQSSVESRMGELGDRINDIRVAYVNSSGIPPGVIHSQSKTIMDGALSTAVELLSQ